jgi:hypothetical protein
MEFGVSGPVEARVDGRPAGALHARQRAVLAVLLLDAGRVVPAGTQVTRTATGEGASAQPLMSWSAAE